MMKAAAQAADEAGVGSRGRPLVVGVTVLTSLSERDVSCLFGAQGSMRDFVLRLAGRAKEAGLDGVVASVEEAAAIKAEFGGDFKVVTPGIRPARSEAGDQKRIATPRAARDAGSDFVVIGRPIIEAPDPLEAARRLIRELEGE
jgi:orotidine-5'-phosphate decarboxylase